MFPAEHAAFFRALDGHVHAMVEIPNTTSSRTPSTLLSPRQCPPRPAATKSSWSTNDEKVEWSVHIPVDGFDLIAQLYRLLSR
jgi:hypothetical protein